LQLITIGRSDGNNIKPQATKRLVQEIVFSVFDTWLSNFQISHPIYILVFGVREAELTEESVQTVGW